jgi:AcrR family transcriptional regulator
VTLRRWRSPGPVSRVASARSETGLPSEWALIYFAFMVARERRAGRMAPDERRAAIVDATLPLVLEHGAAVSTRLIAEAADVAEGTIYRVFPDKDALMCAVTQKAFDPQPTLVQLAAIDRAQPLRERLHAAVVIMQHRLTGAFVLIDALGLSGPPPGHRQSHDSMNDAFRAALVDVVGPDVDALRVPAAELAHILRLLVFSGTHPRISDGRPLSAEQIVSILLDGLLAHHSHSADHHSEASAC